MGYERISCGSTSVMTHRLAWFLYHGEWPDKLVDHIDQDKLNNRIENLRLADARENALNTVLNAQATHISKNGKSRWLFAHRSASREISEIQAATFCDAVKIRTAALAGQPLPARIKRRQATKNWMLDHSGIVASRGRNGSFQPMQLGHVTKRKERHNWQIKGGAEVNFPATNTPHFCDMVKAKKAIDRGDLPPPKRNERQRPDTWLANHRGIMARRGYGKAWARLRLSHILKTHDGSCWEINEDLVGLPRVRINRRHFCEILHVRRAQDNNSPLPMGSKDKPRGSQWMKNYTGTMERRGYAKRWLRLPTFRIYKHAVWQLVESDQPKKYFHRKTFCEILMVARALQAQTAIPDAKPSKKRRNNWMKNHTGIMARRGHSISATTTEEQKFWTQRSFDL